MLRAGEDERQNMTRACNGTKTAAMCGSLRGTGEEKGGECDPQTISFRQCAQ